MASVNKVILLGNVGRDPEMRRTASGKAICNLSIATSSKRKDGQGNVIEDTQWHRVVFFDRLAEIVDQYVKKGKQIYVEGYLKYGKFTNKEGADQNTADIVANELQLLGDKMDAAKQAAQKPAPKAPQAAHGMDDDIPF